MTALLVSDLHLDPSRPEATRCFLRFLADQARRADALYILGDLFETWIGDDAVRPHDRVVITALRDLTASGTRCGFIRGNRDFLIGERFRAETGAEILADETVVTLSGTAVLLMHGDTLCTEDHRYQRYRRIVHTPLVQRTYLALPAGLRQRIAQGIRDASAEHSAIKPAMIMDINPAAATAALRRHGCDTLIHGHTHRAGIYRLEGEDKPRCRIVLGDWYESGSVLVWAGEGEPALQTLDFAQSGNGQDSNSSID